MRYDAAILQIVDIPLLSINERWKLRWMDVQRVEKEDASSLVESLFSFYNEQLNVN